MTVRVEIKHREAKSGELGQGYAVRMEAVHRKNAPRLQQAREDVEPRESVMGKDHPDTLKSVNNPAVLLKSTGLYPEAEPLFRRALTSFMYALGPDHPKTRLFAKNLEICRRESGPS